MRPKHRLLSGQHCCNLRSQSTRTPAALSTGGICAPLTTVDMMDGLKQSPEKKHTVSEVAWA